ncbi:MAG: alpha/beta fold hydrolase [Deltaproteobacteria bacterium]|nr:alpha/beta fold hydrolase [Deltaproteobacteria bacterium]MBN2687782.1 alpha/beta fold hydrolase [Deltaproteobacteria bacterium]
MPPITRVFIHGLESSSQGTKGLYFKENYPDMIVDDYPGTFRDRMDKLAGQLKGRNDLIIVGSSYGGLMAAVYSCEHESTMRKLILLAPALNLEEFHPFLDRKLSLPVIIFHGAADDVVPVAPVKKIAESVFMNLEYHIIDDDHPLHSRFASLPWKRLLSP